MTIRTVTRLLQIRIQPKRPPLLDPLFEAIESALLMLGVVLLLGALAAALNERIAKHPKPLLPPVLIGLGSLSLLLAYLIN